ncbi:MAG: acetyl-CoA hydrolase [Phycisphaerae bacterium]|nr:acetyl-CoA hydrolase [Phycisphaerae bacterium]
MRTSAKIPELTADEAAELIDDGQFVGFSGFTAAGSCKAVPRALAKRARALHDRGDPFRIRVITGASTNEDLDEALAQASAISWRAPYQSSRTLRKQINTQEASFLDIHLSHLPQMLDYGFLGELDVAVVEATDVTSDGRIYLSTSVGVTPSILNKAKRIVVELNDAHSPRLWEMHDIARLRPPPHRLPIPVHSPMSKIGTPFCAVNPQKIVGIVRTSEPDGVPPFSPPDPASAKIAAHVVKFLVGEMRAGHIPAEFLPLQAGVGNVSNAVMAALGEHPDIPKFEMYTEVLQDAQIAVMQNGKLLGASTSALTLSDACMAQVFENMDFFGPRIVLRPQEISNNPGVVRRLGVVTLNTVLEMDIYGCANSTHVCGTQLMNGIGGSGDFVRHGYLSILMAPSTAKGGRISTVVPMCSHVDHNEHSIQALVTEHGLADLRGLGPVERAHTIIETCADPQYRDYLRRYLEEAPLGHIRHDLSRCFDLHRAYQETGDMRFAVGAGATT